MTTDANGDYVIDSSAFNESGLTSGFSIHMQANGPGYLGASWGGPFTLWPMLRNFTLN